MTISFRSASLSTFLLPNFKTNNYFNYEFKNVVITTEHCPVSI
jgi:hypothetical protein